MKQAEPLSYFRFVLFIVLLSITSASFAQQHIYPPEKTTWDADSLGNQRAVIQVLQGGAPVSVRVEWRNRQVRADQQVYVIDSATGRQVDVLGTYAMGPESGIIRFDPASGAGTYYLYFLPYHLGGRSRYYPDAFYKTRQPATSPIQPDGPGIVRVLRLEPVDAFNSNQPMEVIATEEETSRFASAIQDMPFFVFPEQREYPIKMQKNLPLRWMDTPITPVFKDTVARNVHFTFQLGVWAHKQDLQEVEVQFSDLKGPGGARIPADSLLCFNLKGTDYTGKPMKSRVDVEKGNLQALWTGVHIPSELPAGTYQGEARISASGENVVRIPMKLTVTQETEALGGMDKPWLQTRLHWLNSTLFQENTLIEPYTPIEVSGNTLSILGRKLTLNDQGLPGQIQSFFTPEMTSIGTRAKDMLGEPFRFDVVTAAGKTLQLQPAGTRFTSKEAGTVTWRSGGMSDQLEMQVEGKLEFDGYVEYQVKMIAREDLDLKDIALYIPLNPGAARYVMGLGRKGGYLKEDMHWKWEVETKNQDGMWLGDVNAGMQLTLKDEKYDRPLNTNFYLQKPLVLPSSWGNANKGGIHIEKTGKQVLVEGFSGARSMQAGDTLYYNFNLLITPFHPLNTDAQWNERYYHAYNPIDSVLESGSNIINIHHGNELNPYINYPFIATREMKSYIDSAHQAGLKVKIYNTVREVSNRVYELYPMLSLGHEVFSAGPGKGYSWLQEHLHGDYIAAWFVPRFKDAAIINSGMSRWHNYYVEGMNWLVENIGIDGIYLDDVAFDRITMKRIKRALTSNGHPGLIDLHSANQYNERDGYNNSANLYMEHFPYINRLWFGEYFDYEEGTPDFYMTEVSGIPFGLMGEMLQDGGNPYRGLLYGMTNRMPYQAKRPDHIWKAWDDFGMQGSEMIGYWVEDSPVKTSDPNVLATVYKKQGKVMVALASWASGDTKVSLDIDWAALGIKRKSASIRSPSIEDFQQEAGYKPGQAIFIEKNKGCLLIIQ